MNLRIKAEKVEVHYPNLSYSPLLQTMLFNLNFTEEAAIDFLNSINLPFEDPFKIYGMQKAVEVIESSIKNKEKIVIHGDFDVDGVSATTIIWDYLFYERKADVIPIIPHRVDEGYGLSEKTITKALEFGAKLIITVDCGIKDGALVKKYNNKIDFIITDHHQFATDSNDEISLPEAKAVVHSAHPESKFPTMISGAATAWQLVRALEISRNKTKDTTIIDEKLAAKYLDLVAMSTVCDIIPLSLENRKFIQHGCKNIYEIQRIGLHELIKVSSLDPKNISCYHFGFVLGPRLNAAARVTNDAIDALRLLSTKKLSQAKELAQKLDQLNIERKSLTSKYLEEAEKFVDPKKNVIVALGHGWPEGILGLVAGRLAEKYQRPTFIATAGIDGQITGSSRSPLDSFYLNKALDYAKSHLTRYGGHKQAAGFASNTELFSGFEEKVLEYISKKTSEEDYIPTMDIDLSLFSLKGLSLKDIEELTLLEPHGLGNPRPTFLINNCKVLNFNKIGSARNHLKLLVEIDGSEYEAIGFGLVDEYFEKLFLNQVINIIGHLSINEWNNNKKIQIEIKKILFSEN